MPKPADGEATQADDYQPEHPFPIVEAGVLENEAREDTQETTGDGRQRAQQSLWIVIPIMLAQRQELLIHVIGQIGSLGNVTGPMSGHRNPRQHRPIAQ